jgi:hypothetical protein
MHALSLYNRGIYGGIKKVNRTPLVSCQWPAVNKVTMGILAISQFSGFTIVSRETPAKNTGSDTNKLTVIKLVTLRS